MGISLIDFFKNKCDFITVQIFELNIKRRKTRMIHVIASIELKTNSREAFLSVLKNNVPNVKAEEGCLAYQPAVDIDSGLTVQGVVRENVVTIVEAWKSLEHLVAHLTTPHMATYRDAVPDYVENVSVQIMSPA
jgi:quinol monooxygenase YgiN